MLAITFDLKTGLMLAGLILFYIAALLDGRFNRKP